MATAGPPQADSIPDCADRLCEVLRNRPTQEAAVEGASLLSPLRDLREFSRLCDLAELVCRFRPEDARAHRLYAQGLIETGRLSAAAHFLAGLGQRFGPMSGDEYAEIEGLQGRTYKQLFMDTPDPAQTWTPGFLAQSVTAYRGPYERNPGQYFWHGINLGALANAAGTRHFPKSGPTPDEYTAQLLISLNQLAPEKRDQWWYATKAEAHAARGEWEMSENALRQYIEDDRTQPFMLASTLRQLRDLWAIQNTAQGARLLQMLEATLMCRPTPGAILKMEAPHLQQMRALQPKDDAHLQRVTGPRGLDTIESYRRGLKRAAAVAAVTERGGLRFGTAFAVKPADFGVVAPDSEIFVLTNYHVLNSAGLGGRKDFGNVEIVFEAVAAEPLTCSVREVVAESDSDTGLDYALLRLAGPLERLQPLPVTCEASAVQTGNRVYVIGYPLGTVMQFALQDNRLLDHECGPAAAPPVSARRRLQYSASTERGSSGSPVFDEYWDCIALHHAGGKHNTREDRYGLQRLNGLATSWEANQGIWIGSIYDHVKGRNLKLA